MVMKRNMCRENGNTVIYLIAMSHSDVKRYGNDIR